MGAKLQGRVILCDEIGTGAIVRITIGAYKGTLTGADSVKYSGWTGNIEMRHGTDPNGNAVTVYMRDGADDDARFSRDKQCENSATGKHEPSVIVSAEIDKANRDRTTIYMSCRYCGVACAFVVNHADLWQSDPPKVFVPKPTKPIRVLVNVKEELGNVAYDQDERLSFFIVDADQGPDQVPEDWRDLAEQLGMDIDDES